MCVHWGLAMGTLRPTRTPGGARPCRAGGRVAQAPKPPCRSALMGERRTASAAGRQAKAAAVAY